MNLRQQLKANWESRRMRRREDDTPGRVFMRPLIGEETGDVQRLGPHQKLRQRLVQRVLREVDNGSASALDSRDGLRSQARRILEGGLASANLQHIGPEERQRLEDEVVAELQGLGPLDPLVADPTVSDVLVNGPLDVWVDRFGRLEKTPVRFDDEAHLRRLLTRLVAGHGRHIEEATPYVDVRLADGSRLHAMIPPVSSVGPVLSIRRTRPVPLRMEQLVAARTLSPEMGRFLQAAVKTGLNILVSGGASTGKTTLMNVLSQFIPPGERIVTIEETAELRLNHPHVVSLETRLANAEGRGEVTMRTLVRNALRMRADRVIVGEVRGAEVFDMLQAMNLGHNGSLTTVHANNAGDALRRLETLVLMGGFELPSQVIRELLGQAFHLVVHMTRSHDGARRVASVSEVLAAGEDVSAVGIFRYEQRMDPETGERCESHAAAPRRPAVADALGAAWPEAEALFPPAGAGSSGPACVPTPQPAKEAACP